MTDPEQPGSDQIDTNEKGDRHEREAVRILTRLYEHPDGVRVVQADPDPLLQTGDSA